jgi:hypothetical protein
MGDFSLPLWLVTGIVGFALGIGFMLWAYKHIEDPIPPPTETKVQKGHYQ